MNLVGFIGWASGWIVLLGISVYSADWVVWVFLPYFLYGPYRALTQLRYLPAAVRMLRILHTYPWQILRGVPYGLSDRPEVFSRHYGWFELPNPGRPGQWLPAVFTQHLRLEWWSRRMAPRAKPSLKAQIEEIWFAGDVRFVGVIAAPTRKGPAPRRLHLIEQRMDVQSGQRFSDWGAGPEDIERGRQAGVYRVQS
ncbi:hypothetical protein B1H29_13430 [Streptomyces pactum]|uniref:Uncharacterized protein n=2 Tax=Streptomyces pactum TaxID=68249 RepID=A0A1S6JJR0_9ACTN|nr:hypothetical protein B1H29_13430 [Streptomyces pactum]